MRTGTPGCSHGLVIGGDITLTLSLSHTHAQTRISPRTAQHSYIHTTTHSLSLKHTHTRHLTHMFICLASSCSGRYQWTRSSAGPHFTTSRRLSTRLHHQHYLRLDLRA